MFGLVLCITSSALRGHAWYRACMQALDRATRTVEEVLAELHSDAVRGLTHNQVLASIQAWGHNEIRRDTHTTFSILLRQVRSPFIYLLVAASGIAFFLGEGRDASLILIFILVSVALGFFQEYRSEQTLRLLTRYVAARARVVREGITSTIAARDIVPGDLVRLETGDRVPADLRLIETHGLAVDESTITGESVSAIKTGAPCAKVPTGAHEAANVCFSGTTIVRGTGLGVVVASGQHSTMGRIGMLGASAQRHSEFEKSVAHLSAFILRLVVATLVVVFVLHVFLRGDALDTPSLLLFSIALAVGVIPEALPVVATFSLSRGARMLSKRHVVVRRLSAVEDLGAIEVLCTDKTGTITENKLAVTTVYGDRGHVLYLANTGADPHNQRREPFDAAAWEVLSQEGRDAVLRAPAITSVPFDPETRTNAVIIEECGRRRLIVRGAPEALCTSLCALASEERERVLMWCCDAGRRGERTLAVAERYLDPSEDTDAAALSPTRLSFGGILAFKDPVKVSTAEAIQKAQGLGVEVKIITGDAPEVAGAVAHEIGLVSSPEQVLTGAVFAAMSMREKHDAVRTHRVFARIMPEQKYEIVGILAERNVVGFLGEGINDVPALRMAHVSIVVDGASDVSRDVADIILLQKSLHVIIDGIRGGRTAVANTSTYITATLASNFGNFYAVALVSLFIDYLPMLPIQILLLNLISDFPMIAIALDNIDRNTLEHPQTHNVRNILFVATLLGIVSTFFDFMFFSIFHNESASVLQTNWFIGSALTEIVFLFSIRTRLPFYQGERVPRTILIMSMVAFLSALLIPYLPGATTLFRFTPPTIPHALTILAVVVFYFIATELVKLLYHRFLDTRPAHI